MRVIFISIVALNLKSLPFYNMLIHQLYGKKLLYLLIKNLTALKAVFLLYEIFAGEEGQKEIAFS
jgi:hypothetical protein